MFESTWRIDGSFNDVEQHQLFERHTTSQSDSNKSRFFSYGYSRIARGTRSARRSHAVLKRANVSDAFAGADQIFWNGPTDNAASSSSYKKNRI